MKNDASPSGRCRLRRVAVRMVVLVVTLITVWTSAATAAPPSSAVSDKIICQCGCGAVLTNCPHQECGWGVPAKLFISEQLGNGKTVDELVQYYVSQYGEKVLAAPTKRGFNVVAWVTPFVGLVIGAVGIYFLVHLWARRREDEAVGAGPVVPPIASESPQSQKLEDELRDFD